MEAITIKSGSPVNVFLDHVWQGETINKEIRTVRYIEQYGIYFFRHNNKNMSTDYKNVRYLK